MENYLEFIIEVGVLIAGLSVVYFLVRNQLSFAQQRWVLLSIPTLALVVFVFKMTHVSEVTQIFQLPVYEVGALGEPSQSELTANGIFPAYGRIYLLGVLVVIFAISWRLVRILRKLRKSESVHVNGLKVVRIVNEPCFSFMNYIQLNPALSPQEQEVVFQHECIHISKRHSYDVLFMEFMHAFQWFNPLMILLKKELVRVHEYEVDQIMYRQHSTTYLEFLLAYSLGTSSNTYLLTNQFYSKNALIKRMNFMKTKTKNRWAVALAFPMIAGAFLLVSWTFTEQQNPTESIPVSVEKPAGEMDKMPEFKGGQEALANYLGNNIQYPEAAKNEKIEGKVMISFLVEKTGKIVDAKVKHGVHADLDAEALRVVSGMPDWIPGESGGKQVSTEMVLPIMFKL